LLYLSYNYLNFKCFVEVQKEGTKNNIEINKLVYTAAIKGSGKVGT